MREEHQPSPHLSIIGSYNAVVYGSGTASVNVYQDVSVRPVDSATLAAAQQQFGQLPLEVIPDIAPLPPGSRILFPPNPHFVGRTSDLQRLAALLKGPEGNISTSLPAIVFTGLGGVGKTQLVSEFVHRYGRYFTGGVFWLSFAEPASIPAEIAGCWPALGREVPLNIASLLLSEQVLLVLSAWQNALPRLLIFDNCEDEELLVRYRPPTGGCRILLTSRRGSWSPSLGVSIHPLGGLPRQESIALLSKHRPRLAEKEADAIANEVGDLPLALHIAGSFLDTYEATPLGTPARYLEQLRQIPLSSLQGRGAIHSPTLHEQNIERTFAISYNRLDLTNAVDQLALKALARAAYFAPGEALPRRLLSAALQEGETDLQGELLFEDALLRLGALGLLERPDLELFRLHRLLATFVQSRLGAAGHEAQRAVEETLISLEADPIEISDLKQMLIVQRHLHVVTERAMPRRKERALALCDKLIDYLFKIGSYTEAARYAEWCLTTHERRLGREYPPVIVHTLDKLVVIYRAQGRYDEAESLNKRALAIWEKEWGREHPGTATLLSNLAEVYRAQGRYDEAESLNKRALAIWEKESGRGHPGIAVSLNNLALLYYEQKRYDEAEPLYKQALAIMEKELGSEHPDTVNTLNNLGLLYYAQGRYDEAEPLYKQALPILEKKLGSEHPRIAAPLNNLALLYQKQKRYDEAEPLYKQALAIMEKKLGSEHPDTANTLKNLGLLYHVQGRYDEAEPLYKQALPILEKKLGSEHTYTASTLNNLASLYHAQKRYDEERLLMEGVSQHVEREHEKVLLLNLDEEGMTWQILS